MKVRPAYSGACITFLCLSGAVGCHGATDRPPTERVETGPPPLASLAPQDPAASAVDRSRANELPSCWDARAPVARCWDNRAQQMVEYEVPEVAQLERDTGLAWRVNRRSSPSEVDVHLSPKGSAGGAVLSGAKPEDAAIAFLRKYGSILSMEDAPSELALKETRAGYAAFQQVVNGVSVLGAGATFLFSTVGGLSSVASHYIPGIRGMSTTPALDPDAALAAAQADMANQFPAGTLGAALPTKPAALLIAPQPRRALLVYEVDLLFVGQGSHVRRLYIIDAQTGSVVGSRGAAVD